MRILLLSLVALYLNIGFIVPAVASEPVWEELFTDEGIVVSRCEIPGTSLVEFRGKGLIQAPFLKMAAVIWDNDRKTEWMRNCVASSKLERISPTNDVVYNRTGSPFF